MGLDMYLSKKTYVKNWSHHSPEEKNEVTILQGGQPRKDIKPERVSYIVEEVAYWRKFNALHGWFVNECADGVDECQEIYVGERLDDLLVLLKQVKERLDKSTLQKKVVQGWNGENYEVEVYDCNEEIEDLLPPTSGFFFGSDEVDEYFKENVDETVEIIENLLKEDEETGSHGYYYYRASW